MGHFPELLAGHDPEKTAILNFKRFQKGYPEGLQFVLAPDGELHTAASRLFGALRTLAALEVDIILAEVLPETGLGRAINDRLRRAAAR